MRRLWRVVGAVLLLAGGLVLVDPAVEAAEASPEAPAMPTYVCPPNTKPQVCTAAQGLEVAFKIAKAAGVVSGTFESWMDSVGGLDSLMGLGAGGSIECEDIGAVCGDDLEALEAVEPIYEAIVQLRLAQQREAALQTKFDLQTEGEKARICASFWTEYEGPCSAWEGLYEGAGNAAFAASGGAPVYAGQPVPNVTTWGMMPNAVGRTLVMAWQPTQPVPPESASAFAIATWKQPDCGGAEGCTY
ncbi:MAG: hypothetical protein U1C73_21620, partial [Dietzia sp.]|nr:hypothetical protein [Dietzia sp.]